MSDNQDVSSPDGDVYSHNYQMIVSLFRDSPDRIFTVKDIMDITGLSYNTTRQALSRLCSMKKKCGPIKRKSQGLYIYDATREDPNVRALLQYGHWRVENVLLVTKGTQGEQKSQAAGVVNNIDHPSITSARPRDGYPRILPTGTEIFWGSYVNGTQIVRLSAKGHAPFSPDNVITIIDDLQREGLNNADWDCKSIELNVDGRHIRVDASLSMEFLGGLFLKVYQKGPATRIELANRRSWPLSEVFSWLISMANGFDGTEALRIVQDHNARLMHCEKASRLALRVATSVRNRNLVAYARGPEPGFQRASELVDKCQYGR